MEIVRTKPGDNDFQLFEMIPELLYAKDCIRRQQSENINMDFLDACYVLVCDNEPKARLAVYKNPYLNYKEKKSACLGNYECVDNTEISKTILDFVVDQVKKTGNEFLIGPMNGSTWDNYRFSLQNEYPNFLLEPYHPIYYNDHFLNAGFKSIANYRSSIDHEMPCDLEAVIKLEDKFGETGVKIRNIQIDDFDNELKKLYPFISTAFKNNFLYTPISWTSFSNKYKEATQSINPEYFLIAEDSLGNIISFIFCYDDLYNSSEKSLVVKTLARDPSRQWSGLGHVLANKIIRLIKSKNYQSVVHAFMIEHGTSTGASANFLGKVYKNYTLYGIQL
ncbi:MAG TPA: hypothetical protein PK006_05945 [Saprospiraceae bacterium]|nr:hypothetical protein [Saprospiraceae bacterium]